MSVVSSAFALKHAWLLGSCVLVSWFVLTEAASHEGWDWCGEPLWLALRALPPLVLPRPRAWRQRQAKSAAGEAVKAHADVASAAEASNSAAAEAVQAHADAARAAEASSSAAAEAVQTHADVVRAAETSGSTLVQAVKAHFDHLRSGSDDALEEQVTVAATATAASLAAARAEGRSRRCRSPPAGGGAGDAACGASQEEVEAQAQEVQSFVMTPLEWSMLSETKSHAQKNHDHHHHHRHRRRCRRRRRHHQAGAFHRTATSVVSHSPRTDEGTSIRGKTRRTRVDTDR